MGNRRDHFESLKDMWEMFQIILNERKRRAIDPTLAILRQCAAEPVSTSAAEQYAHKRIKAMLVVFEETTFPLRRSQTDAGKRIAPDSAAENTGEAADLRRRRRTRSHLCEFSFPSSKAVFSPQSIGADGGITSFTASICVFWSKSRASWNANPSCQASESETSIERCLR